MSRLQSPGGASGICRADARRPLIRSAAHVGHSAETDALVLDLVALIHSMIAAVQVKMHEGSWSR